MSFNDLNPKPQEKAKAATRIFLATVKRGRQS